MTLKAGTKITNKKIYLSRSKFRKAIENEPNISWLDDYFSENGFEVVYPEKLPLVDLIHILNNAEVVCTVSGTLPHNMMFAPNRTKLWVIEKTAVFNNFQSGVDLLRNLDVTYVDANALIWTTSAGLGPFIVYPNDKFKAFAKTNGLLEPQEWSHMEKRNALRRFIKMYRRHYSRKWILAEWEESEISNLREAWHDTMKDFGSWISGEKPIILADKLYLRGQIKRLYHYVKRLITYI